MANSGSSLSEFHQFAQLSGPHRLMVLLKAFHVHYNDMAAIVEQEYGRKYSRYTINQYFAVGGYLEQAYGDIREQMANEWLVESKQLAKLYTRDAVNTLDDLMKPEMPPRIRKAAAKYVLDKVL